MDRHQEASSTSQVGWHPEKTPSYTAKLKKILLKKDENYLQKEGGTIPRPSKKQRKTEKKTAKTADTTFNSRESVVRKSTSIPKEIETQLSRKSIQPNRANG